MYKQMKKQKKKTFFREMLQEKTRDTKQFKTVTGSPILYTKFRKHKGIYYPLVKHHVVKQPKPQKSHKQAAVVYSKTYGREVYSNIDIWPDDDTARERLLEKLQELSLSVEDDVGIDIPQGVTREGEEVTYSTEDALQTKTPDDIRHVTITVTDTSEDDESASSGRKQIYPDPNRPGSPQEDQGNWPLKRSHSIDSRDNPFLPGGDLSKEADDILKKATIIRDTFILRDEINAAKRERDQDVKRADDNKSESDNQTSAANQSPVKETITQQTVSNTENAVVQNASPTRTRPKENGQVDTENSLTPGSVAVEITDDNKNKKKQKKCCIVM